MAAATSVLRLGGGSAAAKIKWIAIAVALLAAVGWVYVVPDYYVFLGGSAAILAIAALGLTVLVGWAGEVSLAQAGIAGAVVYLAAYAQRADGWGWPYLVAGLFGMALAIGLSAVIALPTAKLSGMYVMVLTLGLQVTLERSIFGRNTLTGGGQVIQVVRPRIFGVSIDGDRAFYFFSLLILVGMIVALDRFRNSRHGRALALVKTDRRAASAMGISPYRYKIMAFLMAGFCAGLAGLLFILLYRTPPTLFQFQAFQSLFYLAIPVVAGFESLVAVAAVALLFTLLPQWLATAASQSTISAGVGAGSHGLTFSPYLIGGVGLIFGTLVIGPRGAGGRILDLLRSKRINASLERYAHLVETKKTGDGQTEADGLVDLTTGSRMREAVALDATAVRLSVGSDDHGPLARSAEASPSDRQGGA